MLINDAGFERQDRKVIWVAVNPLTFGLILVVVSAKQ